jgi:hypothetical protein
MLPEFGYDVNLSIARWIIFSLQLSVFSLIGC